MTSAPAELLTVGHGQLDGAALVALLRSASVTSLVDIRRFPGSRRNPDVATDALAERLPGEGIAYRWDARLGGRRTVPPGPSPDSWWKVEAFRAYAAHTRTAEFADGLRDLLGTASAGRTAVMCSESVWWRCHRRLVADVVSLTTDLAVRHLMPDGRLTPHRPSEGARPAPDGALVWDGS